MDDTPTIVALKLSCYIYTTWFGRWHLSHDNRARQEYFWNRHLSAAAHHQHIRTYQQTVGRWMTAAIQWVMICHDVTWHGASGCACSRTRGRRSSSEIPSSSRACWPNGRAGRAPVAGLCCRSGSGTERDHGGWLLREGEGCAESSTVCRRCCMQTADVGSPATSPTDPAQTLAGNLEVMLAAEQSAQRTYTHLIQCSNLNLNNSGLSTLFVLLQEFYSVCFEFSCQLVSISASDCLVRLASKMTHYVLSGTQNLCTHSLTHSLTFCSKWKKMPFTVQGLCLRTCQVTIICSRE